ncbi:transmembrane protein 151B-like [Diadema setosum]|uniref:transmembrane protein 151B-like n=1 Tax=Diadema setosum TaxID=31175 RepID=UPI003B3B3FF1
MSIFRLPLQQTPIRRTACTSLKEETHWKCLILTLLMYGSLAVVFWCQTSILEVVAYTKQGEAVTVKDSPCQDGYTFIPVAFLVLLYLVYLVECWYSDVRIEIQYKEDVSTVYSRIRRIRNAYPVVWWRAISYHYNRHTRQVTRYRHGDAYTTTQEYFERINTHSAAGAFDFGECGVKDVSRQLLGLEDHPLTKITFNKNFMFLNEEAENDYLSQRARFFTENEGRDENLETREGLGLTEVEFTDEMVTYACSEKLPWYVSMSMFWVTSLSMLSWPFRILISMNTAIVDYQIEKLFGTNYTANMITVEPWAGESGTITRVTAVDSNRSLETLIRDNRHVVPSYSEALLMEVANGNRSRSGLTPTGPGPPNAAHRGKHEHIVHSHDTNTRHNYLHGNGRSRTLRRSATTAVGLCYVSSLSNDRAAQSSTSDWTLRSPLTPNNRSLSNGHTPSTSLRILPSRSTSSHVLAISNMLSRIKPSTNSHNNASAATSESVNRTAAIPTGDSEHNPSLRKPMMSASSTPSNRRHRRPTSLPLCFGSQGSQQDESEVADEMQIESWVLMDGEGEVRTVTWHRANDFNQSTGGEGVVVVPMDSPPPYDAALNMHVPEEGGEGDTTEEQSSDNVETSV